MAIILLCTSQVGYDDNRYFSQIFKKKVGMTIGEYRSRLEPTAY